LTQQVEWQKDENESPRPDVRMEESITFGDSRIQKKTGVEPESIPEEEDIIMIPPNLDAPEREMIDNSVKDQIIINQEQSKDRDFPILVNNDQVLSAAER
jgi:hypothetical protein